jgi:hypothetical protein
MLRQITANKKNCEVYFNDAALEEWHIPTSDIRAQPAHAEELSPTHFFSEDDARLCKKDELKKCKAWYILEILPTYYEWQDEETGKWLKQWRRVIHPVFHNLFANRAD